jgi:multidrug efflux pump subunit AcrB
MRLFTIAAIGAATLIWATPVMNAEEPAAKYRAVEIASGHFRCDVPEGWQVDRDEREEARIHYHGFYAYGVKEDVGAGPELSVRFFAADNTLFQGPQGYLDRQLKPGIVQLAGEKTSEARDVTVAGRPAKTFTRDTFEYFPPESIHAKKIPVREEHFVVPYLGGFVILRFEAPTSSFVSSRKALARALESLRLLPERTFQTLRLTAAGLDPEAVEVRITRPVEAALANTPGLQATWSASRRGESIIVLAFSTTADATAFRHEIRGRLALLRSDLPPRTHIAYDPAMPAGEPVLNVTVSTGGAASTSDTGETRPTAIARLEALTERAVRSRIVAVTGVAEAKPVGVRARYELLVSAERLGDEVDLLDLIAAVRKEPTPAGAAANDLSIDDLTRRVVVVRKGRNVTVGDLTELRLAVTEGSGDGAMPAAERATGLAIRTTPGADSGTVFRAVERLVGEIRPTLPEGVFLEDRRTFPTTNPVLQMLGISPQHFVLIVAGSDLTIMTDAAEEIRDKLAKIEGVADLATFPAIRPWPQIAVRRVDAVRYGFDEKAIAEIVSGANAIIEQRVVCRVVGPNGLPVDVVVRIRQESPTDVGRLKFRAPQGAAIPLTSIADVSLEDEPTAVLHANGRRVVLLTGRIAPEDREGAERHIQWLVQGARLPSGCSLSLVEKD